MDYCTSQWGDWTEIQLFHGVSIHGFFLLLNLAHFSTEGSYNVLAIDILAGLSCVLGRVGWEVIPFNTQTFILALSHTLLLVWSGPKPLVFRFSRAQTSGILPAWWVRAAWGLGRTSEHLSDPFRVSHTALFSEPLSSPSFRGIWCLQFLSLSSVMAYNWVCSF